MVKNISNRFKEKLNKYMYDYKQKVEIIFYDDAGNVIEKKELKHKNLMDTGASFLSATSNNNTFDIGAAVIGSATIVVSNENDWLSEYNFENAKLIAYVGFEFEDGTEEYIKKGVFNMENPTTKGSVVTLETLDNMSLFEKPLSDVKLVYPITIMQALNKICGFCGVKLKNQTLTNENVKIYKPDNDMTCLDAVSYIAQISCNYAKCDSDGALVLDWYDMSCMPLDHDGGKLDNYDSGDTIDGGNLKDYNSGDVVDGGNFSDSENYHHFYLLRSSPTVYTNDTHITGCEIAFTVNDEEKSLAVGEDGYMIVIKDNPFITSESIAKQVLTAINDKAVGLVFRKCSFSAIYDPVVEVGDVGYLSDYKCNSYRIILTTLSGSLSGTMSISCDSKTMSSQNRTGKATTEEKIKSAAKKEKSQREAAIQELAQELATSSGMFMTTQKQADGSSIYYMHDKSTLEESTIVWKLTANAFGISTDGGKTYPYGFDVTGNAILNRIYAIGIIADYILAGTIEGEIIAKNLKMQGGSVNIETSSNTDDRIRIQYHSSSYDTDWITEISPLTTKLVNTGDGGDASSRLECALQAGGLYFSGANGAVRSRYLRNNCYITGDCYVDSVLWAGDKAVVGSMTSYYPSAALSVRGNEIVEGDFYVYGTNHSKNRVIPTSNGDILVNAYETATPLFGDIGQGIIDESGECRVYTDEVFRETIILDSEYNVFLQKYGQGDVYVSERKKDYFIVNGTPGLGFAWEMKARQKGLNNSRLDTFEIRNQTVEAYNEDLKYNYKTDITDFDYSNEGYNILTDYEKEILNYEESN